MPTPNSFISVNNIYTHVETKAERGFSAVRVLGEYGLYGKSRIRCMKRFVRKWPSISPLARRCGGPHIHEYRFGPPTRCFAPSRELGPPGASRFAQSLPSVLPSTSWCASGNLTSHFRSPAGKRSASCVYPAAVRDGRRIYPHNAAERYLKLNWIRPLCMGEPLLRWL